MIQDSRGVDRRRSEDVHAHRNPQLRVQLRPYVESVLKVKNTGGLATAPFAGRLEAEPEVEGPLGGRREDPR
jgi:hypothetical protein